MPARKDFARPELEQYAASNRTHFERLLKEFVEIPSVSAEPDRKKDLERCAELGAATIRDFGGRAEIHRAKGAPPVVLGSFESGKGRPTVTVYNHLDVVPASRETEPWKTDPFTFTQRGDTYFGRGTTDDKGPALSALFGARAAIDAGVPVNIKVLWELEEEVGSPHFADTLRHIGSRAATDAVVVSDTVWVSRARPAQSTGLRGLQTMTMSLDTGATDQHSGTTGGVARNPVAELAQLVGELFDARTGRVKVPGFYDDVAKLTPQELADFRGAGFSVSRFKKVYDFKSIRTNDPLDAVKRLWARPTFEVHGLVGGYAGPGVKTIVPPRAELKVSMRLVPGHEGREDREAAAGVHQEAQSRRAARSRQAGAGLQGRHQRTALRFGQAGHEVRLRQGPGRGAGRRHDRRHPVHGADLQVPHRLHGSVAARARLPRPERELRLGAGQRRDRGLRQVLRGGLAALMRARRDVTPWRATRTGRRACRRGSARRTRGTTAPAR